MQMTLKRVFLNINKYLHSSIQQILGNIRHFINVYSEGCDLIESELEEVYWLIKELKIPIEIGKVDVTSNNEVTSKYSL